MNLADRIASWLERYGPATTEEIARAHRTRTASVRDALRDDPRFHVSRRVGAWERVYFVSAASSARDGQPRVPTHDERVLALLSDGKPHTHLEVYDLRVVAHSRVASLRRKGHTIECWREGGLYLYRLTSPQQAGAGVPPSPSSPAAPIAA